MSSTSERRSQLLQLVADGKISADEAAALLTINQSETGSETSKKAAIPETQEDADWPQQHSGAVGEAPSWLRIKVSDLNTGQSRVSVSIPFRFVEMGLRMGRRVVPELEDFGWEEFAGSLGKDKGLLVDVQDADDGEHVQIYVD